MVATPYLWAFHGISGRTFALNGNDSACRRATWATVRGDYPMSITSLIRKKRDGGELSDEEILRIVEGAAQQTVPDYQLSAFLMAVYFAGMTARETARLTAAMAASGSRLDLSGIALPKVDKHSTGGVGDKVSLILGPIVASQGIAV